MRNIFIILIILLLASVCSATETKIDISQISQTDFSNSTVAGNLANWNSTYNASYDSKEPAISSSTASKFYGWDKTFKDILISYVIGLQDFYNTFNTTNSTVANNLANWNATYNASYSASLNKTFGFRMDNGTNFIGLGNKSILPSDYSGSIIFARVRTLGSGNLSVTFSKATTAQLPDIWTDMCTINMNLSSYNNTGSACQGQTIAVDDNIRLVVNNATVNNATVTLTLRQD